MRKWKQRLWSLLLCGAMLVSLCAPAAAEEVVASGDFPVGGGAWEWVLDSDGRLTIYYVDDPSPRPMPDFGPQGSPWYNYGYQIKSVVFADPDSDYVLSIGANAFESCNSLTEITLPGSLATIGIGAFMNCNNLREITLPDSVTAIGDYAFFSCVSLTKITLPGSLTKIEFGAFSDCTSLTEITLPGSLTTIDGFAFEDCTGLTSITFTGDTPPTIYATTFDRCDSLTEIRVPAGAVDAYREVLMDAGLDLGGGSIELKVEYSITVTAAKGGTASASPDFAAEGDTITLTAKPASG